MDNVKSDTKSADASWWRAPIWTAPIHTLPQHRKLRGGQPRRTFYCCGPRKPTPFKHFVIDAKALTIPEQKLDPIAPAPPGCPDPSCRFHRADQRRQCGRIHHAVKLQTATTPQSQFNGGRWWQFRDRQRRHRDPGRDSNIHRIEKGATVRRSRPFLLQVMPLPVVRVFGTRGGLN
jgi:hypothetical protein